MTTSKADISTQDIVVIKSGRSADESGRTDDNQAAFPEELEPQIVDMPHGLNWSGDTEDR
jgi:hypothetical protein